MARRGVERDDGLGGRHVGHERPHDARPQRPEDRPDLALPGGHADGDRDASQGPRVEGDDPLAQLGADERAVQVERRDEHLADGLGARRALGGRPADRRGAPRPTADADERDVEPLPQVEDRRDPGVRDERLAGRGVVEQTRGHQPARPARRAPRRSAGTARAPDRATSSHRPAARRSRRPASGVSSRASATAETLAPSPMPTMAPSRTAARRTWAASRPTIRRARSSGPLTVGARWTASRS